MNTIKWDTKLHLQILLCVLLCAIMIGGAPKVLRKFYYYGAFIYGRGILRLVLLILLPWRIRLAACIGCACPTGTYSFPRKTPLCSSVPLWRTPSPWKPLP